MHVMDVVVRPSPLVFSTDGLRKFDFDLACWVVFDIPEFVPAMKTAAAVVPEGDGSGKFWEVWDNSTGRVLWTIEALNFDRALIEKRRLCAGCGGRSGWAVLKEVD